MGLACFYTQHFTLKRVAFVPTPLLIWIHRPVVHMTCFWIWIALLTVGAYFPTRELRIAIFCAYVPLSIIDVNNTCHRTFPTLYTLFAVAAFRSTTAQALSLGACTHFFFASGCSKILAGGTDCCSPFNLGWCHSSTMKFYLSTMTDSAAGKWEVKGSYNCVTPLSVTLSKWFQNRDIMLSAMGASAIAYECTIAPALLFLEDGTIRAIIGVGLAIGFHAGIATVQSLYVGADFIPCLPVYIYGLSANITFLSFEQIVALLVAFQCTPWLAFGRMMPAMWPLDPIPLFSWNGGHAAVLDKWRGANRERIILCTKDKSPKSIVGLPYYENGIIQDLTMHAKKRAQPLAEGVFDGMF